MTQVIKDQLVEVIKESIKAAIEKDEWFDVDTIGADIETKLGIDPDTEEIYELICEEIGKF